MASVFVTALEMFIVRECSHVQNIQMESLSRCRRGIGRDLYFSRLEARRNESYLYRTSDKGDRYW